MQKWSQEKARLVARGYQDSTVSPNQAEKDSPTCSRESQRLVMAVTLGMGWTLQSLDVTSEFLQGKDIEREVFLRPPTEARTTFLWKLKKCVYGLDDASRYWYNAVKDFLTSSGMHVSKHDNCVFYFHNDNRLHGIVCCHVDDFFWAGTNFLSKICRSSSVDGVRR